VSAHQNNDDDDDDTEWLSSSLSSRALETSSAASAAACALSRLIYAKIELAEWTPERRDRSVGRRPLNQFSRGVGERDRAENTRATIADDGRTPTDRPTDQDGDHVDASGRKPIKTPTPTLRPRRHDEWRDPIS